MATTTDAKRAAAPVKHPQTHPAPSPDSRNAFGSGSPFTRAFAPRLARR
ncbi:hypothetical protein OH687_22850 [Burkholderia anthina]|nr:hypothetical protein OH687_22850 [Burkholderia anthina]